MEAVQIIPTMSPTEQIYGMDRGVEIPDYPTTPGLLSVPEMMKNSTPISDIANDAYLRLGPYSLDQNIGFTPEPSKPDLTLFCDLCQKFIDLHLLIEHRTYHRALDTLRYKVHNPPDDIDALRRRRANLLKKLRSTAACDKTIDPNDIQRLNDAYEFLKSDLEDTFDTLRRIREDKNVEVRAASLSCSSPCASAVAICADGNDRWKSVMEDTRVFQDFFGNDPSKSFFAVYDGHNGRFAAEVAANELHHGLLVEMEKFDPRTKCTCTFNMADNYDIGDYEIDEIHSRANSRMTERGELHEESANVVQQIIRTCQEKFNDIEQNLETMETGERKNVKKTKENKDPFAEKMSRAFKKAHKYTDYLLSYGKDERSRVRWSGCSTLACVIRGTNDPEALLENSQEGDSAGGSKPNHPGNSADGKSPARSTVEPPRELGFLHLANAGNAHAMLVHGNRAYRLSRDHTPNNVKERHRVLKQGGTVSESERDLRVNSVLATTRGLGNHGDPSLKRCVITEPYTTTVQIDQYAQMLILASNGVWEVFSEHEVASLLLQFLPANQVAPPSHISTSLDLLLKNNDNHGDSDNQDRNRSLDAKSESDVHSTISENQSNEYVFGNKHRTESTAKAGRVKENMKMLRPDDLKTEVGSIIEGEYEAGSEDDDVSVPGSDILPLETSSVIERVLTREERQRNLAKLMSETLTQSALLAGARDNITVMVILLPGCGV